MSTSVYQYFSANGALLYVGVTDRGVRRLHEHAESKPWWHLTTGCAIEHYETRDDALAREESLIKKFRPPYNEQHNPERALPIEQRTSAIGGVAQERPAKRFVPKRWETTDSELKERRRAWYALSSDERAYAPCIECGERPGLRGPSCLVCLENHK